MNLESYVLNKNKEIVGYIVDVLGPVGHHFYALKQ
jgi:rRNA processing protein Gar1